MTTINSASSVQAGQIVRFTYNGGTSPGSVRLVRIDSTDHGHIKGADLKDGDSYKSFSKDKIDNNIITVVADVHEELIPVGTFLSCPSDQLSADTIEKVYKALFPRRVNPRFDVTAMAIVARRDDLPFVEFTLTDKSVAIDFINESGKRLGLAFDYDASTGGPSMTLPHRVICRMQPATLSKFGSQLATHTHLSPQEDWAQYVSDKSQTNDPLYSQSRQAVLMGDANK